MATTTDDTVYCAHCHSPIQEADAYEACGDHFCHEDCWADYEANASEELRVWARERQVEQTQIMRSWLR